MISVPTAAPLSGRRRRGRVQGLVFRGFLLFSLLVGLVTLGATKWQVIWRQVLPAAAPGMATGSILALSRAIGETAPLILIGAVTFITFDPTILGPFTALPIQIYSWVALPQEEFKLLAAAGIIVLLAILLVMNAFAIWLRNRYQKRW